VPVPTDEPSDPDVRDPAPAGITGVDVFAATVRELAQRAPAIVAAASAELGRVALGLHFGDGTVSSLRAHRSRLTVTAQLPGPPDVEVYFDARAMNLIFDMAARPIDEVLPGSLDVRGSRTHVLAVWRTLRLLSQRASGLRAVQELWRSYRAQSPQLWGVPPQELPAATLGSSGDRLRAPRDTGWRALDFLDQRVPHAGPALVNGTFGGIPRSLWDGRSSTGWWLSEPVSDADLLEVMNGCRNRVREEMDRLIPDRQPKASLYDLIRAYPARQGKGLRPTLTIAACAAFGGRPDDAARIAAALELFHNGFLIHDDIADQSTHRRGQPTLHTRHGLGLAVNAGDGLNLLAVDAVLSNLETLGLARTLTLIHEVLHMCRETVEGQAIELEWIRRGTVPSTDQSYYRMSTKKTGWYTCISPCRLGAACAGESGAALDAFNEAFRWIGIAFQIQDDVLNLTGEEALYGKETLGDLLEGKRTVMLIHLMRTADERDRPRLQELLARSRSGRSQSDAEEILAAMQRYGSIDHAIDLADRLARRGAQQFERDLSSVPENEGKALLRQIANYVTTRPL
jgi:geranylgeranyl diphosphate synthase, type II